MSIFLLFVFFFGRITSFLVKDSATTIKQINVKEVINLTVGEHIIVDFDQYNAPYGDAQALLAGYCGSLAIDCNLFPISFDRWSGPSGLLRSIWKNALKQY